MHLNWLLPLGGALRGTLPNPTLLLDEAGLTLSQQVFASPYRRPFDLRANVGLTVSVDAMGSTLSLLSENDQLVLAGREFIKSITRIPTVRAGTNVSVTEDALGYIVS